MDNFMLHYELVGMHPDYSSTFKTGFIPCDELCNDLVSIARNITDNDFFNHTFKVTFTAIYSKDMIVQYNSNEFSHYDEIEFDRKIIVDNYSLS